MPRVPDPRLGGEPPEGKFKTISVPMGLVERAEALAKNYPLLGYPNKTRIMEDALRRLIEELETRVMQLGVLYPDKVQANKKWDFPPRK